MFSFFYPLSLSFALSRVKTARCVPRFNDRVGLKKADLLNNPTSHTRQKGGAPVRNPASARFRMWMVGGRSRCGSEIASRLVPKAFHVGQGKVQGTGQSGDGGGRGQEEDQRYTAAGLWPGNSCSPASAQGFFPCLSRKSNGRTKMGGNHSRTSAIWECRLDSGLGGGVRNAT